MSMPTPWALRGRTCSGHTFLEDVLLLVHPKLRLFRQLLRDKETLFPVGLGLDTWLNRLWSLKARCTRRLKILITYYVCST